MICRSLSLTLAFLLQVASVVIASTSTASYVSIKSGKSSDDDATNVSDLIAQATDDDPLVVFRFSKYPVLDELLPFEGHVPFLSRFFESDVTRSYPKDSSIDNLQKDDRIEIFELNDLAFSASELLYNYHSKGKSVVLFDFHGSNYDLPALDEFMESAYLLLGDSFGRIENMVVNTVESHNSTPLGSTARTKKAHKDKGTKEPIGNDTDVLSNTWTEGLIMCLIVSLLLLGILIVALSWMSSIDISYGALEKSTNPLKKTK